MLVTHMNKAHGVSVRQGCKAASLLRSTYRYEPKPKNDEDVIDALNELVDKHPAIGFLQSYHRLRRAGHAWNNKRVYRVYTSLGLNIRRRAKKRLQARVKQQLFQPDSPNQAWSLDFIHDSLWDSRTLRMLNIIELQQASTPETDTSLPALRVIQVLKQLGDYYGLPAMIRVDNGPEFISHKLDL